MGDIVVPHWGLTTHEATLVSWLKAVGDRVDQGEPLADLETDKTNVELEAPTAGVVAELLVEAGVEVVSGQVVARLSDQ